MSDDADQIIGLYRRHAQTWADRRGHTLRETVWLKKFIALLPEGGTILDLGCGSGAPMGRFLVDQGFTLTGVDSAPEMIAIARQNIPEAELIAADMRSLDLGRKFHGLLAWHSSFHLRPEGQRAMFPIFAKHAAAGAALMFTSGPKQGIAMGEFEGEPLYHASLDPEDYRALLATHGFALIDHIAEDPDCGGATIWLARYCSSES
ncbi:class I SAM-dependent DNA methyltransferase [Paracoccaceae bacterium GXU_MW_L88]